MNYIFADSTHNPERFFRALPEDWHECIEPFWPDYQDTARIIIAETESEVLGGGIVFSTVSPDTHPDYAQEAQQWHDQGYLYIGFLWFSENLRGKNLGTNWLQHVYNNFPEHKFWLAIDESRLASFYKRNGFELIKQIDVNEYPEWVMARHQAISNVAALSRRSDYTKISSYMI